MGQFKPMVKMETTEPSVTLHLKKGGSASFMRMIKEGVPKMDDKKPVKKADGGMMGALSRTSPMLDIPMGNPGAARALAAKRMASRRPAAAPVGSMPMKEGGKSDKMQDKAMVKKAIGQHDAQQHKGSKGTKLALKKGGMMGGGAMHMMPDGSMMKNASMMKHGGKMATGGMAMVEKDGKKVPSFAADGKGKMATGGVVKGQGGYKTGGVVDGQGGYKTGGVVDGQGGYMKGGSAKKPFAMGGEVKSGAPMKMPQGSKPKPSAVEITRLAGTYKRGGEVC